MLAWSLIELLIRNWALVAIVSTVAVLVIVPALIILKYVRISLNIMRSTKPPLARSPLDFQRLSGEAVHFTAYDGTELTGQIIRANRSVPRKGLVLFAHEFCADMNSCARYCRPLVEVGYDVFTFDFRGHGQTDAGAGYTPRQWLSDREVYDMRGAIAFIQDWLAGQGYSTKIGAFGISRGACAALVAAAEHYDIQAIICDGVYSTDRTLEYLMRRWAYIFARVRIIYENHHPYFWVFLRWVLMLFASRAFGCSFPSVAKAIRRMKPRPIFFIHGEKDSYLPVELSRLLYAQAPQPKYFWIAPGAKHNQAVTMHPDEYARLTIAFFDRHLAAPPVGAARQPAATGADTGLTAPDQPLLAKTRQGPAHAYAD